jgi:hypothetical protein
MISTGGRTYRYTQTDIRTCKYCGEPILILLNKYNKPYAVNPDLSDYTFNTSHFHGCNKRHKKQRRTLYQETSYISIEHLSQTINHKRNI